MKECKICNGTGIITTKEGIKLCSGCSGTGVPLYDEDYDNTQSFLGAECYSEEDDDE